MDAERIIENTKRMMESLESHSLSTKRVTDSSYFQTIDPCETSKISDKTIISMYSQGGSKMNQQLLEKAKIIKALEKELKEKNALIDRLNNKVFKMKDDMNRLNEKLNVIKN
jgi:hypothetical protein